MTESVLLAYIKARNPKFIHKTYSSIGIISNKPNFALVILHKLFNSINNEDIIFNKNEKSATILSIFFGILLDFPIFLTLVMLRLSKGSQQKKSADLFGKKITSHNTKKKDLF